jgi:hypothetical protein
LEREEKWLIVNSDQSLLAAKCVDFVELPVVTKQQIDDMYSDYCH